MENKKIVDNIRDFIWKKTENNKSIAYYMFNRNPNPLNYFKKFDIKVELDNCKEMIF